MNTSPTSPVPARRRFFSWRILRRGLIALAWLTTLVALLYGVENWRGRRAWNEYRQQAEAGGARLDLKALVPQSIPDEQNFAATPFVRSWFDQPGRQSDWGDAYSKASTRVSRTARKSGTRVFEDLPAWATAFAAVARGEEHQGPNFRTKTLDQGAREAAASAVLAGLATSAENLEALRVAGRRPLSRYPVVYDLENPWGVLLPHLMQLKSASQRLQLKASAELAAGHGDRALDDVLLKLRLTDTLRDEHFLISHLVRVAMLHITLPPVWEGLAEGRWSDAQLVTLQDRLAGIDLLAGQHASYEFERAAGVLTVELLRRQKYLLSDVMDPMGRNDDASFLANLVGRLAPSGWYELEKRSYSQSLDRLVEGTFDPETGRIHPDRAQANREAVVDGGNALRHLLNHRLLAMLLLPSLGGISQKTAAGQVAVDQAVIACALERHRLAEGNFPESLAALTPRFLKALPDDVLSGRPYGYRRTEDGGFVLYSVGWDGQDDGGRAGETLFAEANADWVWHRPAQ